jgi:arginyl-tRNA synthetase
MIIFKNALKEKIYEKLKTVYPLTLADIELNPAPQQKLGDYAMAFPFGLAKKLKQPPRKIAEAIAPLLSGLEGVAKIEVAGGGYVNLFLDRAAFFSGARRAIVSSGLSPQERKIIVEHTNINPNKAAHIGHLRNACLGDTLVRCLKYSGETVEIQNYIDDTGVQVVDVVYGFMEIEKKSLAAVEALPGTFDYYCWDLYARTAAFLAEHTEAQPRKAAILKNIEHGDGPEGAMARHISRRIIRAHLATMKRLGIGYDILPCESSILGLKFWEKAFTTLRQRQAIYLSTEGETKGCWVMKLEDEPDKEKIIVRSDGTVTYVGKDIAYQLWKFGLLERDFHYEPFLEEGGRTLWITTTQPHPGAPLFGAASKVYNVIDTRQSYLQKVVTQGLRSLHFDAQAAKSVHFSYEMVALSPKSLKELGLEPAAEDKDKTFFEVSGRKGLGVKADDLLDRLEEKARAEVEKRNPDLPADEKAAIARHIACGALRYFMIKFTRNSLIIFDFEEALSFEGETGPYLQYTLVRLNSIFRKLEEREGIKAEDVGGRDLSTPASLAALPESEAADFWGLVLYAAQFDEEVLRSIQSLEFSHLAKFTFNLCQKLNAYYHVYPVLNEENRELKSIRLRTIHYIRETLRKALDLMGIPAPAKM